MFSKIKSVGFRFAALALPVVGLVSAARAEGEDTVISDTVTSMTTGFGLIKVLVLAVVVFSITVGYLKLLKKK